MAFKKLLIDFQLVTLLGVVALACIFPASGGVGEFVKQAAYYAVALLFFVYGAKLRSEAIIAGFANWKLQLGTLGITYIAFPIVAIAIAYACRGVLTDELVIALIYIGILPSTVQSSIAFTAIAKGNVAASVCAAAISNLSGVVLAPLLASVLLSTSGGSVNTSAVLTITVQILLPFALGQICRPLIGDWLNRHKRFTGFIDRGSILLVVYSAFSAGMVAGVWSQVSLFQLLTLSVIVCVLLTVVLLGTIWASRRLGFSYEDQQTLIFCGSTKSLASGVPIANTLFSSATLSLIILPLMIYHQVQLIVCAIIAQRSSAI